MTSRYPAGSIGSHLEDGSEITAYCYNQACGHHSELDLEALARRFGPEHSALHRDLVPHLVCSKCGGKNIGLRLSVWVPGQMGISRRRSRNGAGPN